jgi:hypothetical protein
VIRRVLDIYVEEAPVLMPASAAVFVLTGILTGVLVAAGPGPALIALIISLLATTLFTGMVVRLVADVRDGRRDASVAQLLRAVGPMMGQLILVGIAAAVGIAIGFVLFVIPGLVLITLWSVAAAVVVLERPPALQALARSRELVRGNGLRVFAVILLLDIAVAVVATALELLANSAGTGVGVVVRVIIGVLAAPLSALAAAVLYFELRDISAARPAGTADGTAGGA